MWIPSFAFIKFYDDLIEKYAEMRKGEKEAFFKTAIMQAYEFGYKEYEYCVHCRGRGYDEGVVLSLPERHPTGITIMYCVCDRGKELKKIIERHSVKKI